MFIVDPIANAGDLILITGAGGFIGSRVAQTLLRCGYRNLRLFVRPSTNLEQVNKIISSFPPAKIEFVEGNLLSQSDCERAVEGAVVIYHLAAGRGEKSYPNAYLNSVVTTRNLLSTAQHNKDLKRFLCVSSFTVYSTMNKKRGAVLDEGCAMEKEPHLRGDAYSYAKVRQDELVQEYCTKFGIPFVIVRPGVVYGPGNRGIHGRIGIGTFGIFLHLGGSNRIPLTFVDNCAEAIVLAGLKTGVDGEIFNIVDDDLPTSRMFLKMYKRQARYFRSIYVPHVFSYAFCYLWEKYSAWSEGQLPPAFNRRQWFTYWRRHRYTNQKVKRLLGWSQTIPFTEASKQYFAAEREATQGT